MAGIEFITILLSVGTAVMVSVGGVFCAPMCDYFKRTVDDILDPQLLDEDSYKLKRLLDDIRARSSSAARDKWIDEALENIHQIGRLWLQEVSESTNHNDDHQSSCLCTDASSRFYLRRKIKSIIARGEIIRSLIILQEPVEYIHDVPDIEDSTTAQRNLKRVMDMLHDDDIWCIGLWGPGGVGKTTLVKALIDKLDSDSPFSLVRLIELKADGGNCEVQEAIAKSLGLNMGEGIEERIRNTLQREMFLLILDNLWKSIDLASIGIPGGQAGSKIILTTRFRNVCTPMGAKEIEMGYLTAEEAWQLFAEKAGEVVNDEEIKPLAREVCEECGYLPLALVVVGSAMKGETNIDMWIDAVKNLQKTAPIDDNVKATVHKSLKVRYDLLDDTLIACFLYCSLYPKGYLIDVNELVECWIAEKLIDEQLYTHAYNKGLILIERLKESNILEQGVDGEYWEPKTVKMRDEASDFARWIGMVNKRCIVCPAATLPEEAKSIPWISFVNNGGIHLPEFSEDYCSATSLLLRKTSNEENMKVSTEFVKCFRAVKVLNMERVHSFAASHLQLEELHALVLRNCSNIEELPIADNLKILDLSNNIYLRNTPRGIKEKSNLKVLNLSCTPYLKRIDADTIRNLTFLEILIMCESGYLWPIRNRSISEGATLQDLSELQWLKEVYLELAEADGTYDECRWLERLECFYFSYDCPASSRYRSKTLNINMRSLDTEVGSFILHADELILLHVENVNKIFANFSPIDQSRSKLKSFEIGRSVFGSSSAATSRQSTFLSNVKELKLHRNRLVSSLSDITNALGNNFSELRSLQIRESAVVVFCKDDQQHMTLPQLESLTVYGCRKEVAFDCGPAVIQAIAPNLGRLELYDSEHLESLCNCDSKEKWIYLKMLKVVNCDRLKKVPLMPNMEEIRASIEWWDSVEWQSEETRLVMKKRFKPL